MHLTGEQILLKKNLNMFLCLRSSLNLCVCDWEVQMS